MTGFSATIRSIIRRRSDGWCEKCGFSRAEHFHHRRPRGMGSTRRPESNQPANGLHICADCHVAVEMQRVKAHKHGWLVNQTCDPATIPVYYRGGWVLLDDLGNVREAS